MSGQPITVLMVNEYPDYIDAEVWAAELKKRVPQLEFRLWPDVGNKGDIDIALIDKGASPGFFDAMTGLRAVVYLGAGVDGIDLQSFPKSVPLIRLATREQASEVVQYIVLRVLCQQRHVAEYLSQQARKIWNRSRRGRSPRQELLCWVRAGSVDGPQSCLRTSATTLLSGLVTRRRFLAYRVTLAVPSLRTHSHSGITLSVHFP